MGSTYILRKGVSSVLDLKDGANVVNQHLGADGRLFYVDVSSSIGYTVGNDAQSGLKPSESFATLQAAIDACEDWRGDVILCKAGTQTLTEEVTFDCKGITVIAEGCGLPARSAGERFMLYGSHTDAPAAIISAPCKIIGMGFCGSETAGGSLEINGTTGGFDGGNLVSLINCRFSHWGIAKAYAIILQGTGDVEIGHCYIDGYTAGYTTAAIECQLAGSSGTASSSARTATSSTGSIPASYTGSTRR